MLIHHNTEFHLETSNFKECAVIELILNDF